MQVELQRQLRLEEMRVDFAKRAEALNRWIEESVDMLTEVLQATRGAGRTRRILYIYICVCVCMWATSRTHTCIHTYIYLHPNLQIHWESASFTATDAPP